MTAGLPPSFLKGLSDSLSPKNAQEKMHIIEDVFI